jgi:hypothetical protein
LVVHAETFAAAVGDVGLLGRFGAKQAAFDCWAADCLQKFVGIRMEGCCQRVVASSAAGRMPLTVLADNCHGQGVVVPAVVDEGIGRFGRLAEQTICLK